MNRQRLAFGVTLLYLWIVMIHLGALIFETIVIYPNIFYNVPQSLELGMEFMAVRGPADFFPLVGMLSLFVGGSAVLLSWSVKSARYWLVGSILLILVGEFLLSAVFFWPRNEIMFLDGLAVHSATYLQQTAKEFQTGHWLRVGSSIGVSVTAFVGFLRIYRQRIIMEK